MEKLRKEVFVEAAKRALFNQGGAYRYLEKNKAHETAFREFREWNMCDSAGHRCLALLFAAEVLCE